MSSGPPRPQWPQEEPAVDDAAPSANESPDGRAKPGGTSLQFEPTNLAVHVVERRRYLWGGGSRAAGPESRGAATKGDPPPTTRIVRRAAAAIGSAYRLAPKAGRSGRGGSPLCLPRPPTSALPGRLRQRSGRAGT